MSKVNKLKSLYCLLIALTLCAVSIFALNFSKVKADEEGEPPTTPTTTENVAESNEFWLESGADVYINDTDDYLGIRFTAKISESYLNTVNTSGSTVKYWIIVAPAKNVTEGKASNLSLENYATVNAKIINATGDLTTDNSNNKLYRGSVKYDFSDGSKWTEEKKQAMIDLQLVARPCLAIIDSEGKESFVYANLDNAAAKVMSEVADKALANLASTEDEDYADGQLNTLLSYVKEENVNAYHATDSDQSGNIAFINQNVKGYTVYKKEQVNDGNAKFTAITSEATENEKASLNDADKEFFKDVEDEADTAIYLSNGTDFIKTTAKQITKVIYDYDDLKTFDLTGGVKVTSVADSVEDGGVQTYTNTITKKFVEGYYVLGNDMDVSSENYVINRQDFQSISWSIVPWRAKIGDTYIVLKNNIDENNVVTAWIEVDSNTPDIYVQAENNTYNKANLETGTKVFVNGKNESGWSNWVNYYIDSVTNKKVQVFFKIGEEYKACDIQYNGSKYQSLGGFKGMFDGMGHSLTMKTGAGLFNFVCAGSVIKNVEFKDMTVSLNAGTNTWYSPIGQVTGTAASKVSVSDIKISFSDATYDYFEARTTNTVLSMLSYMPTYADYKNIVVEIDYNKMQSGSNYKSTIAFFNFPIRGCTLSSNVYLIELSKPQSLDGYLGVLYAETDDDSNDPYYSGKGQGKMNGFENEELKKYIGTYASYDAMKGYFETEGNENKLSEFDSDCWDITSGYPVWKNSATEEGSQETQE